MQFYKLMSLYPTFQKHPLELIFSSFTRLHKFQVIGFIIYNL
jgi:hypothetical protein